MPRFRLQPGPVPLHHQVYLDLRAAIENHEWAPGDRLPTERELAARYGCSLITIRRALDELSREGRLQRTRGRGTFVSSPPIVRDLAGQVGFGDEIRAFGLIPYAVVVTTRREAASTAVAAALALDPGTPVWYLERVRGADGTPLLLEQVRLPADRLPGLLERDFSAASLWDVLATDYGLPVESCREVLSAVLPTEREAKLLRLSARRPAVQLDGTTFTTGRDPIECSRTLVSPEHAQYFVESTGYRVRALGPAAGPRDAQSKMGSRAAPARPENGQHVEPVS